MSNTTKGVIAVLAVVVLLGAGYMLFFSGNNATGAAVSDSGTPASDAEVQFLQLSSQIGAVSFDTSIFSDPRFTSLVDIHTAILNEATGRTDPFANIAGVSSDSTTGAP